MFKTACAAVAAVLLFIAPATAQADPVRFWGYWQAKGTQWTFAPTGPAQAKPADGTVEGWRFAASSGDSGTPPRTKPDFAAICGSATRRSGGKLVAVVVDFGAAKDAPQGQQPPAERTGCANVPAEATGTDVLAAVGKPQFDAKGLMCALDSFPAGACGAEAQPAQPAKRKEESSPVGLYAGIGLVLLVAAAGTFAVLRRRQSAGRP